jgi:hypothetical protein
MILWFEILLKQLKFCLNKLCCVKCVLFRGIQLVKCFQVKHVKCELQGLNLNIVSLAFLAKVLKTVNKFNFFGELINK